MRPTHPFARRQPAGLFALVLACGTAAAAPPPAAVPSGPAAAVAADAATEDLRTRVYVVNGADPFGWAGLARLAARVRANGYPQTRYGEVYEVGAFEREIRDTAARDPAARFALVGFSAGTLPVRAAAHRLAAEGVPVALVGYVGGDYLTDTEYSRPAGVGRVVNVTGNGYLVTGRNLFWNGTDLTGAANVRLAGVPHFGLPTHPATYRALMAGLADVSAGP